MPTLGQAVSTIPYDWTTLPQLVSLHTTDWIDALTQNLIHSPLFLCQPFKSLVGKQTSNERINDLLQRKNEWTA